MTPWGKAQSKEILAIGIKFYSTASHGGFKLNKAQNARIPLALRNDDGWYEEDCECYKVFYAYPELFPNISQEDAIKGLKRWYPNFNTSANLPWVLE